MGLPTVTDAKAYCRIETADEDIIVSQLLARAKAAVETFMGYPLTAAAQTYVTYGDRFASSELQLPGPFLSSPTPTVTDVNGTVVDTTTYVLDNRSGKIRSKFGDVIFGSVPYTIVATVGLSAHPDYSSRFEAVASTAILDLVAHWYQNRDPNVSSGQDEGGGSFGMSGIGHVDPIPPRVIQSLLLLPAVPMMA